MSGEQEGGSTRGLPPCRASHWDWASAAAFCFRSARRRRCSSITCCPAHPGQKQPEPRLAGGGSPPGLLLAELLPGLARPAFPSTHPFAGGPAGACFQCPGGCWPGFEEGCRCRSGRAPSPAGDQQTEPGPRNASISAPHLSLGWRPGCQSHTLGEGLHPRVATLRWGEELPPFNQGRLAEVLSVLA